MNCPKCGVQNVDGVTFCGNCGASMPQTSAPQQNSAFAAPAGGAYNGGLVAPKNYMTESILVTVISLLCCCSPISVILGIIAIVKANNVNQEFRRGNISEAIREAASAKTNTMWAFIVMLIWWVISVIIGVIFFVSIANELPWPLRGF